MEPRTKQPVNERGIAGEIIPATLGVVGALGGAIVGGPPGAVAGAGLLSTAGEGIQQGIERLAGDRTEMDPAQAVATGVGNAAFQAIGGPFAKLGSTVWKVSKPSIVKTLGRMSNFSEDLIQKALERSPQATIAVKEGNKYLSKVVPEAIRGVNQLVEKSVAESKAALKQLVGKTPFTPEVQKQFSSEGRKIMDNIDFKLADEFRISMDATDPFARSSIIPTTEQSTVRAAHAIVKRISEEFSIDNIDSGVEQLISLAGKTPKGTPTGPMTKKIVYGMLDEVEQAVKTMGRSVPGYAEYATYLEQNAEKRVLLNQLREIFGTNPNPSPADIAKVSRRLLSMYNTEMLPVREMVEKEVKGVSEAVAGTLIKTTGKQEVAGNILGSSQTAKTNLLNLLPNYVVRSYLENGDILGFSKAVAKAMKIPVDAASKLILNSLLNKTTERPD